MNEPIRVFTSEIWRLKAGKEDAFSAFWDDFARWTLANFPGGHKIRLLRDKENPALFTSFGGWENVKVVEALRSTKEYGAFLSDASNFCESFETHTLDLVKYAQIKKAQAA